MAKSKTKTNSNTLMVTISDIYIPDNVRDPGWEKKLKNLMSSIKQRGVLQPVGLFPYGGAKGPNGEKFELVFGYRRLEACKKLKHSQVPARVLSSKLTAKQRFLSRMAENDNRDDLTPMEEARAFQTAIQEYKIPARELAKQLGKTDGYISQRLQLLKLPEEVQESLEDGKITPTHAREIASVTDEDEQRKLLQKAEKMSVTDFKEHVEANVDRSKRKGSNRGRKAKKQDVGEKSGVRSEKEATEALGRIDDKLKAAREKGDKPKEAYYKGMIRGIAWTRRMTGGKKLF